MLNERRKLTSRLQTRFYGLFSSLFADFLLRINVGQIRKRMFSSIN